RDAKRQVTGKQLVPNDGTPPEDEIDVSVEGRLMMFQDGVERLLGLKERRGHMLRTGQDCDLFELRPEIKELVPSLLRAWFFEFLEGRLDDAADKLVADAKGLPPLAAAGLRQKLRAALHGGLTVLRKESATQDFQALKKRLADLVQEKLID